MHPYRLGLTLRAEFAHGILEVADKFFLLGRPMRLRGTEKQHNDIQKSHAKVGL